MFIGDTVDADLLRFVYDRLREEFSSEADRMQIIESKLVAVTSIAPVAIAILLAVVTFLSSAKAHDFTPVSVGVLAGSAFYIALQFLRAMLAGVGGLARAQYSVPTASSILPADSPDLQRYIRQASIELARRIEQHRETTNGKVSQLALAHASIVNAIGGLILAITALGIITFSESMK